MPGTRTVLAASAAALVLTALPAAAHVTAHSYDATSGGTDAEISFRVPNEENTPTVKVVLSLPADKPIAGVYPEAKAGWTATVHTRTLTTPIKTDDDDIKTVVDTITWTATGGGIPVANYDYFTIAAGLLPTTNELEFKALQTYKNGDVVRWIDASMDADHPAPRLELTASGSSSTTGDSAATPTATPTVSVSASPAPAAKASDDTTTKTLAGTGLALGAIALLVGIGAFLRSGRRAR